jgi:hypothetical protein
MNARDWGILALGAIGLAAAPAFALDTIAGTYEGKATCRQIAAAVRICTFSVKRTSVNVPPVIPCTPAP